MGELLEKYFSSGRFALLSVAEQIDARSAGGKLCLTILASVSEWERNVLSERTGQAMQHLAAEGRFTGGVAPYGYDVTDDGVMVQENAESLRHSAHLRSAVPPRLIASSTSARSATEMPPRWPSSQSQWRGSSVTSRATTPSLGRPGPAFLAKSAANRG